MHWGRADPSKRLQHVLEAVNRSRIETGSPASFTQIGSPSTPSASDDWREVLEDFPNGGLLQWVEGVPQDELRDLSAEFDVFLHAFTGSMDKAALEAAATGLPVLSENPSVRREVGAWPGPAELAAQLVSFVQSSATDREAFAAQQQQRVREHHSLEALTEKLIDVIYPG